MSRVLPILFNTEMVRAILEERKTVTRRLVKFTEGRNPNWTGYKKDGLILHNGKNEPCNKKPPYQPGDILYVRETWKIVDYLDKLSLKFEYEADGKISDFIDFTSNRLQKFLKYINKKGWCPALFMPKEAARIWLKVTDVRVERLQEITPKEAWKEGAMCNCMSPVPDCAGNKTEFIKIWDSTLKKSDLDRYGWDANPYVFVIEFERCEKPESEG